jgi:signal transduction histidine kinase
MQVELLQLAGNFPENNKIMTRLTSLCKEVHHSMNDVVWSLNSRNDGWANLLDKLTEFGMRLFDGSAAHFSIEKSGNVPEKITQEERQAVYFFIREALNNACKHSNAQTVQLRIDFGFPVKISIHDDGVGFDTNIRAKGNGINNMKIRAGAVDGQFSVQSSESGTVVMLQFNPKT